MLQSNTTNPTNNINTTYTTYLTNPTFLCSVSSVCRVKRLDVQRRKKMKPTLLFSECLVCGLRSESRGFSEDGKRFSITKEKTKDDEKEDEYY